ncbi:hypothetical protein LZ012_08075 [Dechloromonas sp. XY25]|uniref:Response regulatory domain-containing protein n=1 Tax=Dechloromonas hankyongensis TaxID=2908002 RepID=A0ABS9K1P0_9RHOO|nr:hypothetical protein [Dechloromonas hankyongensis]MCG2576950.1 hypothetical protein [Dechloromonas hankyongensis]
MTAFESLLAAKAFMHKSEVPLKSGVEPSRTVLCVDDELNVLAALRRLLQRHGYEVLLANSGEEGLQR